MSEELRQPVGGLAFAAALVLVGLVLRPNAETVGTLLLAAGVVVGVMSLLQIARALGRRHE